ncbi:hypothetical protein AN217_04660 [Streptomyces qinglanensis]|uniref:Uncharacterized protein n=1 Tax=Streptomyces qinglanensis TaxID=943816 RepID=A0A1E7K014_9ACTN|nr:hypothetical protein [Streptomyces qinglanensis]OEU97283.1 hypothetical protein AN217_04660 [Streptomyces qinglanensis]OEV24648.1 hypothetical protein AN220_17940 [Streptomyces nanshensis]
MWGRARSKGHPAKEKLKRTVEAYRQFEQGRMPAGPGADALLTSFRAVEKNLADRDISPDSPRVDPVVAALEQCSEPVDRLREERRGRTFPNGPLTVSE